MLKTNFIANVEIDHANWYFVVVNYGDCYKVFIDHDDPTNRLNIAEKLTPPSVPFFIHIENKRHSRNMVSAAIKALAK